MTQPELPRDRYGRTSRQPMPRWARVALLSAGLILGGIVAVVGYYNLGTQPIEGKQTAYRVVDDHSIQVSFEVVRDEPDRPAVCIVRARSADGDEVGRREVFVPASENSMIHKTEVRTSRKSVTGLVFGCSYQVPEYLSSVTPPSG